MMPDLSVGDFLYQSDQELFLVVIEEHDDSYTFAAHGWREIGKERIDGYVEDSRSKIYEQEDIEELIDEQGGEDTKKQLDRLKQLFAAYEDNDVPEDGPQEKFALEET